MWRALPMKDSRLLHSRKTRVLRSTVSQFFPQSLWSLNMNTKIENPGTCKVQPVIWFLKAKNFRPAGIHRQITEVYGESAMNEGNVRKWCRLFKGSRMKVHGGERSGRATSSNGKYSNILYTVRPWTRWFLLVSQIQEIFGRPESEEWPRDKERCAGLTESLGGDLFRRRHTKAFSMIWQVSYITWRLCGEIVLCKYQHSERKVFLKNSLNAFYTIPVLTFWTRYVRILWYWKIESYRREINSHILNGYVTTHTSNTPDICLLHMITRNYKVKRANTRSNSYELHTDVVYFLVCTGNFNVNPCMQIRHEVKK
jgi:hypothetical protein